MHASGRAGGGRSLAAEVMTDLALIRETLSGVADAVRDELQASASQPGSRFALRDGRQIARSGANHLWSFEFDGELSLGPETVGQLQVADRDPLFAMVLAVGDLDLVLSVRDELGDSLASATLIAQPLFILDALRRRLTAAADQLLDTEMLENVLDLVELADEADDEEPRPAGQPSDEVDETAEDTTVEFGELSYEQLLAVGNATRDGLQFVWGPPGTGKTSTLAATVAALVDAGRKVLVLAHSNAAVDVAMVRVAAFMTDSAELASDQVLRVGTPQLADARDCSAILPDEIMARRFPGLGEERRRLEAVRERISGDIRSSTQPSSSSVSELEDVRQQLAAIESQLALGQADLVRDARVVGCTLAKAVIDPQLWAMELDAVIVDEASMAGIPFVMAIAARSPRTLACFGDFRQLPPIAISEKAAAKAWFGRDIFEVAGVVSRVEEGVHDRRLSILQTQYRMGETIAAAVSEVAYFSLLSSHVDAIARARELAAIGPQPGVEVTIVDTSGLHTSCLQDSSPRSFSRFNPRSAAVSALLAQQCHMAGLETGVITPYRAQVALVAALLRSSTGVTAASMHRFQGSERDAIIVDLVDAAPQSGPSRLTGKDEDLALRLLNVGISRARGKLLMVVDVSFLRERSPRTSPAVRFIDTFIDLGAPVVAAESLVRNSSSDSVAWGDEWWSAVNSLSSQGPPGVVEIGLGDLDFVDDQLPERLSKLKVVTAHLTLHAPIEIAGALGGLGHDIRLMPLGAGALAICRGKGVVVGGRRADEPAALLRGAAITLTVQRLLQREA